MIRKADIGILSITGTYLTMFIYLIYAYISGELKNSVDIAFKIGKNPYLFIINLVLFMIGGYLILQDIEVKDREKVRDILFFLIPTANLVLAFLYLLAVSGGEGAIYFSSEVYFILMYNTLLYLIGILTSIKRIEISKEVRIILGYVLLFAVYALVRLFIGVYPVVEFLFLIIVLAYTLYIPRIKSSS